MVFIDRDGIYKPSQVSTFFGVWMGSSEYRVDAISPSALRSRPPFRQPAATAKDSGKAHSFQRTFWIIQKFSY